MIMRNATTNAGVFVRTSRISMLLHCHCLRLCLFFIAVSLECISVRCWDRSAVQARLVAYSFGSRVSKRLETIVVLDTTTHVCRDGNINFLWI